MGLFNVLGSVFGGPIGTVYGATSGAIDGAQNGGDVVGGIVGGTIGGTLGHVPGGNASSQGIRDLMHKRGAYGQQVGPMSYTSSGINIGPQSDLESSAYHGQAADYRALRDIGVHGPGRQDMSDYASGSRNLSQMMDRYAQGGWMPGQSEIDQSNSIAERMFGAQRVGMQQSFADQTQQANRRAALMGRAGNDPILAAKLAQEQTRQSQMLGAQQGAWAQNFALQMPGQNLQYAQMANLNRQNLASQAMSNRQALLQAGNTLQNSEFNKRLSTADRWSESTGPAPEAKGFWDAVQPMMQVANTAVGIAGMPGMSNIGASSRQAIAPQQPKFGNGLIGPPRAPDNYYG